MESHVFYNAFFNVEPKFVEIILLEPKKPQEIMISIKSLPDDLIQNISGYLNIREMTAKERYEKLGKKSDELLERQPHEWLTKLQQKPHLFNIVEFKVCAKIVKIDTMVDGKRNLKYGDLHELRKYSKFYNRYWILLKKIIHSSLPKITQNTLVHTHIKDFTGDEWYTDYCRIKNDEDPYINQSLINMNIQGCENKYLRWWTLQSDR